MENQQEVITPYPQKDIDPAGTSPQRPNYSKFFLDAKCDLKIARQLKNIYAGKYSAFSNFSYSTYGQIAFAQNNPAISALFSKIVLDDVSDINTLGAAILAFGGNARFTNGQGTPWSARYLNYSPNQTLFLNNIIKSRQQYLTLVQAMTTMSSNQSLNSALNQVALTTQNNILLLQKFINN